MPIFLILNRCVFNICRANKVGGSSEAEGRVWLTTHMSEMACGWYDVVAQVSGYLVVYFLMPSDVTRGSRRG